MEEENRLIFTSLKTQYYEIINTKIE